MSTEDDDFRASGPGLFGFLTTPTTTTFRSRPSVPSGMRRTWACWDFPASRPTPRGQSSRTAIRSARASRAAPSISPALPASRLTGWASMARWRTSPPVPTGFRAGVLGAASTQPGVIGFSRDGDGIEGASFTSTAVRAVSFFGPGVQSISGALNGVSGISGTQGPPSPTCRTSPASAVRRMRQTA